MSDPKAYRSLIADVYELAGSSRASSEAIAERFGQTASRWHVLSVLSEPHTVASAARRLGLARQSVHRVVDELVGDELVHAIDNPDHKSSPLIKLTPAGADSLRLMTEAGDVHRTDLLRRTGITAEDMNAAKSVLRAIIDELD